MRKAIILLVLFPCIAFWAQPETTIPAEKEVAPAETTTSTPTEKTSNTETTQPTETNEQPSTEQAETSEASETQDKKDEPPTEETPGKSTATETTPPGTTTTTTPSTTTPAVTTPPATTEKTEATTVTPPIEKTDEAEVKEEIKPVVADKPVLKQPVSVEPPPGFFKDIYLGVGVGTTLPFASFLKPGLGVEIFAEMPVWKNLYAGLWLAAAQHGIAEYSTTGTNSSGTSVSLTFTEDSSLSMLSYGLHSSYFYSLSRKITIGGGLVLGFRSLSNSSFSLGTGLLLAFKSDAWYNLVRNIDLGLNIMYALSSSNTVTQDDDSITFEASESTNALRIMVQARYKLF